MSAQILDGKKFSETLRKDIAGRVEKLTRQGMQPGLAVILVGNDPASEIYVRNKENGCAEVGIHSETIRMTESTSQEALEAEICRLNGDDRIHGILVQLPLAVLRYRRYFDAPVTLPQLIFTPPVTFSAPLIAGAAT